MFELLIDMLVGATAGFLTGLLGSGNALVVLPALIFIFSHRYSTDIALHLAIGTSLATSAVSILATAITHHIRLPTDWKILRITGPAYFIASLLGPQAAHYLPLHALKIIIVVLIFFAAFALVFKKKSHTENGYMPSPVNLFSISFVVSFLSSISGMASGVLIVPYLTWINVNIKKAVAIAVPSAVIFCCTATAGYIINGWGNPSLPKWSLGYVYLPTMLAISFFAAIFSPFGVKLHHKIDVGKLKRLFALLLVVAGLSILILFPA